MGHLGSTEIIVGGGGECLVEVRFTQPKCFVSLADFLAIFKTKHWIIFLGYTYF